MPSGATASLECVNLSEGTTVDVDGDVALTATLVGGVG